MMQAFGKFLRAEDGAAALDWMLLAASLVTLIVVSVGTATGEIGAGAAPAPVPAADSALSAPATTGLGS